VLLFQDFWSLVGPAVRRGGGGGAAAAPGNSATQNTSASGSENSVASKSWPCQMCTLVNPASASVCDACFTPKDSSIKKSPPSSANQSAVEPRWSCGTCTYLNSSSLSECDMCGNPKPAITSATSDAASTSSSVHVDEYEQGGRRIELIHINGLVSKASNGLPTITRAVVTTVDHALGTTSGMGTDPFEETLHTKWPNCIVESVFFSFLFV